MIEVRQWGGQVLVVNVSDRPQTWNGIVLEPGGGFVGPAAWFSDEVAMGSPFGSGTIGGIPFSGPREDLPVSDHGLVGAIPLPASTWNPWDDPLSDADWAAQNRTINDLLAGRTRA